MEFVSKYMKIIKTVLWVLIVFFGYKVYNSINGPIEFNKVKNERYLKVIDRLNIHSMEFNEKVTYKIIKLILDNLNEV